MSGPVPIAPISLDSIDKAIIRELQIDGRMPYAKLAGTVGLSQAAARQRVQRLIRRGVANVVAVTDPLALGFQQADLGIRVSGDPRAVVEALSTMPEVDYLRYTAGRFQIMAEVTFLTPQDLHDFVNRRLREIPAIDEIETLVVLERVKETHNFGIP